MSRIAIAVIAALSLCGCNGGLTGLTCATNTAGEIECQYHFKIPLGGKKTVTAPVNGAVVVGPVVAYQQVPAKRYITEPQLSK